MPAIEKINDAGGISGDIPPAVRGYIRSISDCSGIKLRTYYAIVGIEQAKEIEKKEHLGIQYHVGDALKPYDHLGEFDVVFSGYLLHYATDKNMLKQMLVNIYKVLKTGGVFVTLNDDPDCDKSVGDEGIPFGFTR